jgi:hypothetical protein
MFLLKCTCCLLYSIQSTIKNYVYNTTKRDIMIIIEGIMFYDRLIYKTVLNYFAVRLFLFDTEYNYKLKKMTYYYMCFMIY